MIKIKKEKENLKKMNKILNIFFALLFYISLSQVALAESKIANKIFGSKDCSQYSTKTLSGLNKYVRCKKGLKQNDSFFFSSKFKNKNKKQFDPNIPCDQYSSKTMTGLASKIKCKRAKKN